MTALAGHAKQLLHVPEYMVPTPGQVVSDQDSIIKALHLAVCELNDVTPGRRYFASRGVLTAVGAGLKRGSSRNGVQNRSGCSVFQNHSSLKHQKLLSCKSVN